MSGSGGYAHTAIRGFLALLTGACLRQAVQLVLFILLARLLAPESFGTIAIIMSVLTVAQVLSDFGVSVALVQRVHVTSVTKDSAFCLTMVCSVLLGLVFFACSGPLSLFYGSEELGGLLRVASLILLLRGVFSFFRSLLLRELRYRAVSAAEILGVVMSGLVAVILAFMRPDASCIVWGELAGMGATLSCAVLLTQYCPRSIGTTKEMLELLQYGSWVATSRVLERASGQFDRFLLGKLVAPGALGIYYIAYRLAMLFPNLATGIIDQALLPVFSQMQQSPTALKNGYWRALRLSAMSVLPISILTAMFAEEIVLLMLGAKWETVIPLTRILSMYGAIQSLGGGIFGSLVYASGRPRIMMLVTAFRIIILPTCLIVGCLYSGVVGAAWGAVTFALLGRLFSQWVLSRFFGVHFLQFFIELVRPLSAILVAACGFLVLQGFVSAAAISGSVFLCQICVLLGTILAHFSACIWLMPKECEIVFSQIDGLLRRRAVPGGSEAWH